MNRKRRVCSSVEVAEVCLSWLRKLNKRIHIWKINKNQPTKKFNVGTHSLSFFPKLTHFFERYFSSLLSNLYESRWKIFPTLLARGSQVLYDEFYALDWRKNQVMTTAAAARRPAGFIHLVFS